MNERLPPASIDGSTAALRTSLASSRLKVLHVGKFYPPHMGGIETHLQVLSGALRHSVDLSVIVANSDARTVREVIDGVPVLRLANRLTVASAPVCPSMVRQIRAADADLVHIHVPNPAAILAYLASGHRGRLVVGYHSDTVRQRVLGSLFEPFFHVALRRSSAIIASSLNYLQSSPLLAGYRDRCHVIPYGIDVAQFQRSEPGAVAQIREQYGERLILSVGRLVSYKGFEYLVRAMRKVRGRLLIVGEGPLRSSLQNLASTLGVAEKVVFVGRAGDLIPYYHATDVFALASVARSEAFGIVQIEAMAAGLPVVNTRLDSGVPFVSLDGETGLTVPPANPSALAAALNQLLDNRELRRSFGQAARLRAQQEFSVDMMAKRTLQLYEKVMAQ